MHRIPDRRTTLKRQHQSHRIEAQKSTKRAARLTQEQQDQIMAWLAEGYTAIEAARAGFRAWGRDISPSTIHRYQKKGIQ